MKKEDILLIPMVLFYTLAVSCITLVGWFKHKTINQMSDELLNSPISF